MSTVSIVPVEKVKHDPQTLLYYYPSMSPQRYTKLSNDFYHWKQVQLAEQVARHCGRRLVPASCLHWQRKLQLNERKVTIKKRAYYLIEEREMTNHERQKYIELLVSVT